MFMCLRDISWWKRIQLGSKDWGWAENSVYPIKLSGWYGIKKTQVPMK